MKKRNRVSFLLIGLLAGCGSDVPEAVRQHLGAEFQKLDDSEIIARVGDSTLTKRDVVSNITLLQKLSEHRAQKALSEGHIKSIVNRTKSEIVDHFTKVECIYSITHTNGLNVSAELMTKRTSEFYSQFANKGEEPRDLARLLNQSEHAIVEKMIASQLELEAYIAKNCSNALDVTEAQIDAAMKRITDWNAMVAATNAYAHSMASNIVKWVEEGADFGELADKYSQDPDKKPGGLIDDHAAVSFFNGRSSYLEMLDQMPVGKVSDILPSIEGLLIVKALGKDPKTKMPLYQRIVLQTGEPYPKMTRKDLRQIGENELMSALHERLIATAKATVKIEYPHGADFLKPKQAQKGLLR